MASLQTSCRATQKPTTHQQAITEIHTAAAANIEVVQQIIIELTSTIQNQLTSHIYDKQVMNSAGEREYTWQVPAD
jgi:hypothetical protein